MSVTCLTCVLLTVSEASNPSKSGNGNMRHIPIHAENGGGGSCRCAGCSVSLLSDQPSHLPSAERRKAAWAMVTNSTTPFCYGCGTFSQFVLLNDHLTTANDVNSQCRGSVHCQLLQTAFLHTRTPDRATRCHSRFNFRNYWENM